MKMNIEEKIARQHEFVRLDKAKLSKHDEDLKNFIKSFEASSKKVVNTHYDQLHLGYYTYDNQIFLTREDALDRMLAKGDYAGNIQFYYNDHVFSTINWEKTIPFASISYLYKMRAQQLRDKYRYLILRYSGGSDSTQVLESFLKNGIFLDEIVVVHHQRAINRLDRNMLMRDETLSEYMEYEMAVIPQLKRVKELSPNTKITLLDSSDNLVDQLGNKKYEYLGYNDEPRSLRWVTGGVGKNWAPLLIKHERQSVTKESVAIIRGLEKPVIDMSSDGKIFFLFSDSTLNGQIGAFFQKNGAPYTIEDFYWSPDFPLIPVKQCHMIIDKLIKNEMLYNDWRRIQNIVKNALLDPKIKSAPGFILDRWYNTIIYPDWDPNIFVGSKPTNISPDIKLVETLGISHTAHDFYADYQAYKWKKYDKIINKSNLNKTLFSRLYYLGQFKPEF
jgi:hypothetical protein